MYVIVKFDFFRQKEADKGANRDGEQNRSRVSSVASATLTAGEGGRAATRRLTNVLPVVP